MATANTQAEWLSLATAAELIDTSVRTVRDYIASGKLPAYRTAGRATLRVRRCDLEKLFQPVPTAGGAK